MVAVKGKLNTGTSRIIGDGAMHKNGGNKSFKVYSENERVKVGCNTVDDSNKLKTAPSIGESTHTNEKGNIICSEKSKVLKGVSVKANSGRRALVDVSNVQRHQSKNAVQDPLKLLKGKPERSASLQRSVIAATRKPQMGQLNKNNFQGVVGFHTSKRVVIKSLKVSPNSQRTKSHVPESADTDSRVTERKPPLPIPLRKSLPVLKEVRHMGGIDAGSRVMRKKPPPLQMRKSLHVLKEVNQNGGSGNSSRMIEKLPPLWTRKSLPMKEVNKMDRSDVNVSEKDETSDKSKGKYGFPVKTNVGRKVVTQARNSRSHLWKNRVSDGIIIMAPRDQNLDGRTLSRDIRSIAKGTLEDSNAQRGSKLFASSLNVRKTSDVATLKNKNTSILVSFKSGRGELQSDCIISSRDTTDTVATKKIERRRSYTSSLMARSKLFEQHGEVKKDKQLPSIDDKCNQLEVAEYVDEIYQYYWVTEAEYPSLADYMKKQTDITPQIRGVLINWLIEVHCKFDLMQETLYLMMSLLDRYLSIGPIQKNEMQLVGLTALLLASKYEDFWHPRIKELISISADSYSSDDMLGMEKLFLKKLKFRLNVPTLYVFMLRFLKAAQSDTKLEHLSFYLIELCLVQYEALKFKSSMLCASAIYLARCTLQINPSWTPLLAKHARYQESEIRACAEMILRFHKAAKTTKLNVTYEKFMKSDRASVAAIKPLDQLPY